MAATLPDFTAAAGRYEVQKEAERSILPDVMRKLEIQPSDHLLDIVCSVGSLRIPLSFVCAEVTGIDHQGCIERIRARFPEAPNIKPDCRRLHAGGVRS